jgi:hypothetical protein
MPAELAAKVKAKSKRNAIFRRWEFWALASTALVGATLARG